MSEAKQLQGPTAAEPRPLADVVRDVEAGFKRLLASGLNRKAVVVLLHDSTGIGKRDIELVLAGLGELARDYTRKDAK